MTLSKSLCIAFSLIILRSFDLCLKNCWNLTMHFFYAISPITHYLSNFLYQLCPFPKKLVTIVIPNDIDTPYLYSCLVSFGNFMYKTLYSHMHVNEHDVIVMLVLLFITTQCDSLTDVCPVLRHVSTTCYYNSDYFCYQQKNNK